MSKVVSRRLDDIAAARVVNTGIDSGQSTAPPPLLLTASEAAAMFKAGLRTWRTWHATGRIPQPIRIGRKVFWRPEELRAWVAAGCPDRETWAVLRE